MKIVFGDRFAVGVRDKPDSNLPTFFIQDFPLPRKYSLWDSFPTEYSFQPEMITPFYPKARPLPRLLSREDLPHQTQWQEMVATFKTSNLKKIVLARQTTITLSEPPCPLSLLSHLQKTASPTALPFALILSEDVAFIGLSPEKLFVRNGSLLYTEALAGTRPHAHRRELFHSTQLLEEFLCVKEEIARRLEPICSPFALSDKLFIKEAGHLSHLHYPFHVTLKETLSDKELIKQLHPTPALAGLPKQEALDMIFKLEPFDRGLYGGIISMLSKNQAQSYIAIRSALIIKNKMHLFAGAGIVPSSSALEEWQELDQKISPFIALC